MINIIHYILESSFFLIILLVAYLFLKRNSSRFSFNRFFLLLGLILAHALPLLNFKIAGGVPFFQSSTVELGEYVDFFQDDASSLNHSGSVNMFDYALLLKLAYITGILIFSLRFIYCMHRMIRLLTQKGNEIEKNLRIHFSGNTKSAFSIFNHIFISSEKEIIDNREILTHELIHKNQFHTIDLLFVEFIFIFHWFNPVLFFIRKSLIEAHEFLADEGVIKAGYNPIQYQKVMFEHVQERSRLKIANYFSDSLIKKRIKMLKNSKKDKKQSLAKLLIISGVFCASIFLFSFTWDNVNIIIKKPVISAATMLRAHKAQKPSICPIKKGEYSISSPFGMRMHPIYKKMKMHSGIDLKAEKGTPVMATADGTVLTVEFKKDWGRLVIIDHGDGYVTYYSQLHEFKVEKGQKVEQGQVIAAVGSTGMSTGPHLHYEVRVNGKNEDPKLYFE